MPDADVPTARTRVRRMAKRGRYDKASVHAVLDAAFLCHVGYVIDGQPFVTPTCYWREGDHVYLHGAFASRMLRTTGEGMPVCVTVSIFDGFVLARSGFHHSVNYRSAMLFGRACPVADPAAKRAALDAFVERLFPGRGPTLRPITRKELNATTVLQVTVEEASAKVRTGPPIDDRADFALPIWAGVLPVAMVQGAPEPDPKLMPGVELPAELRHLAHLGLGKSPRRRR